MVDYTRYFATCARGLEPILDEELRGLDAIDVAPGRGGVAFAGDRALLYRANLCLRTAIRVVSACLPVRYALAARIHGYQAAVKWQCSLKQTCSQSVEDWQLSQCTIALDRAPPH